MTIDSKNLLVAIKAYSRANPLPLDASEVHDSLAAAQEYAASAKAYPGQTIKVLQNGVYETYVLNPTEDGLGLTLGKIGVDESQFKNYVQVVETLPESGQEQGVIYITSDLQGQIWNGSAWQVIFKEIELGNINEAIQVLDEEVFELQESVKTLVADANTEGSVDYKIAQAITNVDHLKREVVAELPQENIDTNTIYMISVREDETDLYDEYMFINGKWEVLGNTAIDLSNYYTKDEVYNKTEADATFATIAALAGYALKSDIPSVPTKVSELENDLGFLTEHQDLSDYVLKSDIPDTSEFAKTNDLQNYVALGTFDAAINQLNSADAALAGLVNSKADKTTLDLYALKTDIPDLEEYAKEQYVQDYVAEAIANAKLEGDSSNIDLSIYAKKSDLGTYTGFDTVIDYVDAATNAARVQIVEF